MSGSPQARQVWLIANPTLQVNTQMVVGTLMNLADEPNVVSTGQNWRSQVRTSRRRRAPEQRDEYMRCAQILRQKGSGGVKHVDTRHEAKR